MPWYAYRDHFLTAERIDAGVAFWTEHRDEASPRSRKTRGVAPHVIVGIIGAETYFGRITGKYRVVDALSTLAFDYPPRSSYFRAELEQFLLLVREEGFDTKAVLGSYAGAMGNGQFMPRSYRAWAVDGDGDGKRDLWGSWPDVIASVANYLADHGWRAGEPVVAPAEPLVPESGRPRCRQARARLDGQGAARSRACIRDDPGRQGAALFIQRGRRRRAGAARGLPQLRRHHALQPQHPLRARGERPRPAHRGAAAAAGAAQRPRPPRHERMRAAAPARSRSSRSRAARASRCARAPPPRARRPPRHRRRRRGRAPRRAAREVRQSAVLRGGRAALRRAADRRRLRRAGRRILVRPGFPRRAHVDRRDLRHERDDRRASDAAAADLGARDEPREWPERRRAPQRPRPLRARTASSTCRARRPSSSTWSGRARRASRCGASRPARRTAPAPAAGRPRLLRPGRRLRQPRECRGARRAPARRGHRGRDGHGVRRRRPPAVPRARGPRCELRRIRRAGRAHARSPARDAVRLAL